MTVWRRSLLAIGCAFPLVACETHQELVTHKENHLAAAGFVEKMVETPEQKAAFAKLTPYKFIRVVKGDKVSYLYADPTVCGCVYVGSQQAYGQYEQYKQTRALANEEQDTALDYQNTGVDWDWGPWGWGPMGPVW
ncbi:MAG: hypothetical protein LKH33_11275 [Acetobacter sp.]|jgi:hypothetical protein|nr:hypothetical protein [Acetobacter sp.]MCH4061632.1 hypothetical protein [Acetobacter sp.]MCH4089519.1 hypothetical protein [Acetobacter sp.]MCI1294877.1 hypothetical protein [Acetobacter sp.]MCI1321345.1 hypothetical protein [Acetobacter sp.]